MYISPAMERHPFFLVWVLFGLLWTPLSAQGHEGSEFNSYLVDFTKGDANGSLINTTISAWGLSTIRKSQPGQFRSNSHPVDLVRPRQMQTVSPVLYIDNFLEGQVEISLRFSSDSLSWGSWQALSHHEPWHPYDSLLVADPIFVGTDIKYFQFLVTFLPTQPGSEPVRIRALRFDYFTPGDQTAISPQDLVSHPILGANINPSCDCEPPLFATRTEWGCPDGQSPSCAQPAYAPVSHMIVHHSATPGTATNWAAVVLSIWNYHVNTNGWCDIGYNWLIAPDGVVYEGRGGGNNVRGAHFCGTNTGTMGICMMGTYEETDPTPEALASLEKLLAWKGCDAGLDVTSTQLHASSGLLLPTIAGHQDGCNTLCPGQHLYADLPSVRTQVSDQMEACAITSIAHAPLALEVKLYPNPSEGQVTLALDLTSPFQGEVVVRNHLGQLLEREELRLPAGQHFREYQFSTLPRGLYYIQLRSARRQRSLPLLLR
ncbi:MAG: T9SS C-terminal target domain-containing protein [Bacteroidetes bacterium]|nr:MAG: T9SS C-terminal target domain-containing protein [Bacteroidota bacterium]